MHDRPLRVIMSILIVALATVTLGGNADGREIPLDPGAPSGSVLAERADRDAWCTNLLNAPALLEAAEADRAIGPADQPSMLVLEAAVHRPVDAAGARLVGSRYVGLADRWIHWDRVCRNAFFSTS